MMPARLSARDLFASARDAAIDSERMRRMLLAMESAEVMPAPSQGVRVAGGGTPDPMRKVDARIDREAVWSRRAEENERVMDYATSVLYGSGHDGGGGVDALLGHRYADILWWRYLAAESWETVAEVVGYSERRCHELEVVALDYIDANGVEATIAGRGAAEG